VPHRPLRRKRDPMSYYVTSFISILHFISDDLLQCDATTTVGELFCDEFDDLDFELALCCFEATHKVAFADKLWEVDPEDYEDLTIEEFIEQYVDGREQRDPLFVTKRFLMFQESLTKALTEEQNEPPEDEAY
jgi:broad specificity phosphatase PhoE